MATPFCAWWNEWLLPLFTMHGKHMVEPRWPEVFQNLCVQVYNIIILFIAVTAEKIQTAMLHVHCKRFCKPYQGPKNSVAYLLDTAPL